ncbi:MerR family transcriptional regulator [Actinomadura viridis]|uniref:MerR family transcriptional regulator n=1 Tax=Actinomadura viridis TaxID=58110 RepID=UPI00369D2AFE
MLRSGVKIGEASRVSGVSVRSLRFYEDEGLIVPGRCGNGYRDYCRPTLDRILVIRSLLEAGLPMRLIKEVLPHLADGPGTDGPGTDGPGTDGPGTDGLGIGGEPLCAEFLDEVQRYRDRLAERIAALSTRQAALDAFLHAARATDRGPAT